MMLRRREYKVMSVLWDYKTPLTVDEITEYLFPGNVTRRKTKYVFSILESLLKKSAIHVNDDKAYVRILTPEDCLAAYVARYSTKRRRGFKGSSIMIAF